MPRRGRRWLSSGHFLLTVALLGMLFIMVNYIGSRRYTRWDLTRQKITALSDQTVQTLRTLKQPVSVVVFYQPSHRLYGFVRDLVSEYRRVNPAIEVEYVDPERDIARAKQLAQEFAIEDLNLVVFRSGSRQKQLSDLELADYDYTALQVGGEPRVTAFKGEDAFTSALINITQQAAPLVWFTTGHGEKSPESADPLGLSNLATLLKQQGIASEAVTLAERSAIPDEVNLVVIAGPTRRFLDHELDLLQAHLDRGGRCLVLIDPLEDAGLEGWLARWGVALGNDIVVDPSRQLPFVSAANLLVTNYTQHPIVDKMSMLVTLYPLARSARPSVPSPEGLTVTPLASTSPGGWGETDTSVGTFTFDEGRDLKGPVPIAVAAERSPPASPEGAQASSLTRVVVIGDSDFVTDSQLGNVGNRDLALGVTYWLIEQEQLIGIGPKPIESIHLNLTGAQLTGIFWFSFLAMPCLVGVLGVGMWWVRRR